MLTIDKISFSYNNDIKIINNISLNIQEGIHSIIGINGSGKTTLLKLIFGLLSPSSGNIQYNGFKKFNKHVSYVSTEDYYFSYITGREHLSLFENKDFDTNLWAEIMCLPLDNLIDNYSSGMKKKLAILTSLKRDKDIYIFDEPFNGLDLESCHIVSLILKNLKHKGKTIIIATHIMDYLDGLSDCYYIMSQGVIKEGYENDQFLLLKKSINNEFNKNNEKLIFETLNKSKI